MADGVSHFEPIASAVPIAQIIRSRADFPTCKLRYEIQFTALDWNGIGVLATICESAGLDLVSLRVGGNGCAFCVLADSGTADVQAIGAGFSRFADVSTWTIHIAFEPH